MYMFTHRNMFTSTYMHTQMQEYTYIPIHKITISVSVEHFQEVNVFLK